MIKFTKVNKNLTERTLIKLTNWQSIMAMVKRDQIISRYANKIRNLQNQNIKFQKRNMKSHGKIGNQKLWQTGFSDSDRLGLGFTRVSVSLGSASRLGSGFPRSRFSVSGLGKTSARVCLRLGKTLFALGKRLQALGCSRQPLGRRWTSRIGSARLRRLPASSRQLSDG